MTGGAIRPAAARRRALRWLPCLALLALPACAGGAPGTAGPGSAASGPAAIPGCTALFARGTTAEVYFGLSRADGSLIPRAEGEDFVARAAAAAFPDGFTLVRTTGYWRDKGRAEPAREPSLILKIVHPAGADTRAKLSGIARRYARHFGQSAVLLSTARADAWLCR